MKIKNKNYFKDQIANIEQIKTNSKESFEKIMTDN